MSRLHLLWRIIYHSLYYFLTLILLILLCATPADAVRQALLNKQRFHILILIVCLSVALVSVVCIYFFRLYVTRTALASIPKLYVPIEKGDVPQRVRKMIVAGLSRSAAIAYESRPRVVAPPTRPLTASTEGRVGDGQKEKDAPVARKTVKIFALKKATTAEEKMGIELPPHKAVWGEIEHYGWASPNSPDLPNLQYSTVIQELPNLIEAKALTLAPPNPEAQPGQSTLDPEAIALLQRPDNLGLRQYLARLAELGVLAASRTTAEFLSSYEYARYSTRPISLARFRELMHHFAEVLRTMQPLDPAVLRGLDGADDGDGDGDGDEASMVSTESDDIDNDAPRESPSTPRSRVSVAPRTPRRRRSNATSRSGTSTSTSSNGSQIVRRRPPNMPRNSSQGTWAGTWRTAPSPASTSSADSFAQTRRPYDPGGAPSSASSGSRVSIGSAGSGGSVIRLSERVGPGELPYVLSFAETHQGL